MSPAAASGTSGRTAAGVACRHRAEGRDAERRPETQTQPPDRHAHAAPTSLTQRENGGGDLLWGTRAAHHPARRRPATRRGRCRTAQTLPGERERTRVCAPHARKGEGSATAAAHRAGTRPAPRGAAHGRSIAARTGLGTHCAGLLVRDGPCKPVRNRFTVPWPHTGRGHHHSSGECASRRGAVPQRRDGRSGGCGRDGAPGHGVDHGHGRRGRARRTAPGGRAAGRVVQDAQVRAAGAPCLRRAGGARACWACGSDASSLLPLGSVLLTEASRKNHIAFPGVGAAQALDEHDQPVNLHSYLFNAR